MAFDNVGSMFDQATKTYRYKDAQASVSTDGTLITHPAVYGKDPEVVGHSQNFYSLYAVRFCRLKSVMTVVGANIMCRRP